MEPREIKAELIRKGISLTSIAATAGTSRAAVSMCISGNGLKLRIRAIIAKKLGKKVSDVFGEHHPQPTPGRLLQRAA